MASEVDLLHLLIRYLDAFAVLFGVESGTDAQAGCGTCGANEVQDGFVVDEGLCSPVTADEGEHAVLDGIPLRGAGRKMTEHGESR